MGIITCQKASLSLFSKIAKKKADKYLQSTARSRNAK